MAVFREFTQEWVNHESEFNHMQENNVLYDFFDYTDSMYNDLKNIKKYYESSFNSLSKKSIDKYIYAFEKLCEAFKSVCLNGKEYIKHYTAHFLIENVSEDVLYSDGNKQKIKDKYYKKLKALAEQVFKLEDECFPAVEQIWIDELMPKGEHNISNYSYLAHVCFDQWRKQEQTPEFKEYCKNLAYYSTSYINNDKTKFFLEREYKSAGMVGYLVNIEKGAFIAGGYNDIFSTEYINGKCEFYEKYNYSPVKKLYVKGNNVIYGNGTRLCTPKSAINSPVGTPNEILLDREHISFERPFYLMPEWNMYKENLFKKLDEMGKIAKNSDPLRLCSFNKLDQMDYDMFCEMQI